MAEANKTVTVRALIIGNNPSFVGEGVAGHLVEPGTQVIIDVLTDEDGEPILGSNMQLVEKVQDGSVVGTVPAGLPTGAVPAGPGVWLVPVGNGLTYEPWQPGDPTTNLSRMDPDAFSVNQDGAKTLAEVRELNAPSDLLDSGKAQTLWGYQTKADIAADLDALGVEYETDANRATLLAKLDEAKAKS